MLRGLGRFDALAVIRLLGQGEALAVEQIVPLGARLLVACMTVFADLLMQAQTLLMATMVTPELLLLDEPAAGMNPQETLELTAFIRSIRDRFGLTIFLIEHHMNLVMDISDRIYVIDFGKQIAAGVPAEIQNDPRVIDAYLGVDEDA